MHPILYKSVTYPLQPTQLAKNLILTLLVSPAQHMTIDISLSAWLGFLCQLSNFRLRIDFFSSFVRFFHRCASRCFLFFRRSSDSPFNAFLFATCGATHTTSIETTSRELRLTNAQHMAPSTTDETNETRHQACSPGCSRPESHNNNATGQRTGVGHTCCTFIKLS